MIWIRRKWFRISGTYSITDYIQENSRIQQEAVSDNADNRENTKQQSSRRKAIISPSDLSHHRTYRSVYGGSINLTCNSLFGVVVFHGYKTKLS